MVDVLVGEVISLLHTSSHVASHRGIATSFSGVVALGVSMKMLQPRVLVKILPTMHFFSIMQCVPAVNALMGIMLFAVVEAEVKTTRCPSRYSG